MNCPVCKYPNPAGVTHCGMCYEVFNRSAAQAYLQRVRKERRMAGKQEEKSPAIRVDAAWDKAGTLMQKVDWAGLWKSVSNLFQRLRAGLLVAAALAAAWVGIRFLFSPTLWFHLSGSRLEYAFSEKKPSRYFMGFTMNVKSWSERQGRLDTPLEEFKVDEIGNVVLERKKAAAKAKTPVNLRVQEWIQIVRDAGGSRSRSIPLNHPSLAGARLLLDKRGALLERRASLSPRLGKGFPFLAPKFPKGRIRRGRSWPESIEWIEMLGDWKLRWTGTLRWRLDDVEPCGRNTCARLTYQASLRPQLWSAPSWATGAVRRIEPQITSEGVALFDARQGRLVSNTFSYDGLLRIPITDLGRIPWELRIGRRVRVPGDILIRFQNKIDIRKN